MMGRAIVIVTFQICAGKRQGGGGRVKGGERPRKRERANKIIHVNRTWKLFLSLDSTVTDGL